jgi:hypothetical protein
MGKDKIRMTFINRQEISELRYAHEQSGGFWERKPGQRLLRCIVPTLMVALGNMKKSMKA